MPWVCWCFETRPKSRGREDSAEEVSQRNWTAEQSLPAPTTFRKVPVLCHTATNPLLILFLHPSAENPQRKYGSLRRPATRFQSGSSARTQVSVIPLPPSRLPHSPIPSAQPRPPSLAAQWHRWGRGGRGELRHRPGPGFAKSRASAACGGTFAHGHALSAEAAPSDPLRSSCSSLATLPNCSRPSSHFQL